jgi:CRISPR-associated protein Cas1
MTDLHIISKRGKITKTDEHLLFRDIEGNETRILPSKINQILLYENISITGEAFNILAKNKIPLSIKTYSGIDNIHLQYEDSKNVFLRQNQYRIVDNQEMSLKIAKSIVSGKIKNQISFLQRIKRNDSLSDEKVELINEIKNCIVEVENCKSVESLRGIEGIVSRKYFSVLAYHIKPSWAIFENRSKQPPKSNVNAVLSFLYSLLSNEVSFVAQSRGLDIMVGNLHTLSYGRDSLVYDLVEEFRTPIADTLCCYLFNDNILSEEDFENRNQGVYLTKTGIKKVVKSMEEKLEKRIIYKEKEISHREIILNQVEQYKDFILGKKDDYVTFFYK